MLEGELVQGRAALMTLTKTCFTEAASHRIGLQRFSIQQASEHTQTHTNMHYHTNKLHCMASEKQTNQHTSLKSNEAQKRKLRKIAGSKSVCV